MAHDTDAYIEFDYERVTSPMQAIDPRNAGIGALVALVGLLVVFGLPLALV